MHSVKPAPATASTSGTQVTDADLARLDEVHHHIETLQRNALGTDTVVSLNRDHAIGLIAWRKHWSHGLSHAEQRNYQQAEKLIVDCIRDQREQLFLGNLDLRELPDIIWHLRWLKHLHIGGNHLTILPPQIGQLQALTHLTAGRNRLQVVPDNLGMLRNMEVLDLSWNFLTSVPDICCGMSRLEYLYLNHTRISTLPPTLKSLPSKCTVLLPPPINPETKGQTCDQPFGAAGPAVIYVPWPAGLGY